MRMIQRTRAACDLRVRGERSIDLYAVAVVERLAQGCESAKNAHGGMFNVDSRKVGVGGRQPQHVCDAGGITQAEGFDDGAVGLCVAYFDADVRRNRGHRYT
ncbi:MAG: hypothetical protein QOG17_1110 [Gammaproteobacteria bacterium]|nr:hypothetical protein [Gammaproteobacteria bacterium]